MARDALRWVAIALVALGFVLAGVAQAFPWRTADWGFEEDARTLAEAFGEELPEEDMPLFELYQWGLSFYIPSDDLSGDPTRCTGIYFAGEPSGEGCDEALDDEGAEEDPFTDSDGGEMLLKSGFVVAAFGVLTGIAAVALAFLRPGIPAALAGTSSGLLLLVAALLTTLGAAEFTKTFSDFMDEEGEGFIHTDDQLHAGIFLGFAGGAVMAAGGGLMFAVPAPGRTPARQAPTMRAVPPRPTPSTPAETRPPSDAPTRPPTGGPAGAAGAGSAGPTRQMKCPRCGTMNRVAQGQKPVCTNCGLGR